jgi:hypothetical protein
MGTYWSKFRNHSDHKENYQQEIRIILLGKTGLGNLELDYFLKIGISFFRKEFTR